jgi:hypothetical protein
MTFAELLAELVARGAENNPTRNGRWINLAYREIANAYDWPFTEVTATGTAGTGIVAVADVRKVHVVGDISAAPTKVPGRKLDRITFDELSEDLHIEDVAQTGIPEFWWLDSADTTIKGHPLGGTIYVRYQKRLAELTGVDVPAFNAEYHLLIVERAMSDVYADIPEDDASARALQRYERGLLKMASDYQVNSREHSYIQVGEPYDG